ncbi:MAG: hypothetical protein ACREEM_12515 [Blastocatellia bacterium]
MAIRQVSVFLTPNPVIQNEIELRTFPDPVIANIIVDVDTGELIEIDQVLWNYTPAPPPEAQAPPVPQPPAPDQVYLEIRFGPRDTPYPPPSTTSSSGEPVEADSASYGNVGTVPVSPNEPRLDAGTAPPGQPQQTEEENGFEFLVREYKYAVVLTAPGRVHALDPKLKIRQRHRRLQQ